MTPAAYKALAWIPVGVQACVEELGEASSCPYIAASKLLGELLLVRRAIGQPMQHVLNRIEPHLIVLRNTAMSTNDKKFEFTAWQIKWLSGDLEAPPRASFTHAWEARYFLENAGIQTYSSEFWKNAAAQALQGALTDDAHLRRHLYNFTHAVFYGSDFGRRVHFRVSDAATVILSAIPKMLAASQEWDLYYEVQAARAMTGTLAASWLSETEEAIAFPGQNLSEGWVESSPAEQILLLEYGLFEKTYAKVHSTLAALLAFFVAKRLCINDNPYV